MKKDKISLIITGDNRFAEMDTLFASLCNQSIKDISIQVIFVNQGDYAPPLSQIKDSGIEFIEIKKGRLSLSAARNIGLSVSDGNYVGFPDDDCWYGPGLIEEIMLYFRSNVGLDVLCVNVFDPYKDQSYGSRPTSGEQRVNYWNVFSLPISVGIFIHLNEVTKHDIYFDEKLGAGAEIGSGEETDLISRLLAKKAYISYNGDIRVYHRVPDISDYSNEKHRAYGVGFGYISGKMLLSGSYELAPYVAKIVFRSAGGVLVNVLNKKARQGYQNRIFGIFQGLIESVRDKL